MSVILAPGTLVYEFRTVELVGDGTLCNVYLAERDDTLFWLIQIESPDWHAAAPDARTEQFEIAGSKWAAIPVNGSSMVELGRWVDRLEVAFIGWRWAVLARGASYLHERDQTIQLPHGLSLDRLVFGEQGELLFDQSEARRAGEYAFPPPEAVGARTPASDVYSLAASLDAILGATRSKGIDQVLRRATDPDPAKRYKNAGEFGAALAQALPDPNRVRAARPGRPLRSYVRFGCWLLVACIVLGCIALIGGVVRTLRDPAFQQQIQQQMIPRSR